MTTKSNATTTLTTPSDREIVITRVFDAPRATVWKAWTEAKYLTQWWGPNGWSLPVCEVDLRPGGTWFYCMQGPDAMQSCGVSVYQEIVAPERLVYTDAFADAQGNVVKTMPEALITLEFIEDGGKTTVRSVTLYASAENRDTVLKMGVLQGITETLDRLEVLLKTL